MEEMNEKWDKTQIICFICSILMGAISIFLFIKFQDSNIFIFNLASGLLISALIIIEWVETFYDVKPFKLSVILTMIVVIVSMLSLYFLNLLGSDRTNAPIAISLSYASGRYLKSKLETIEKIYNKYFNKNIDK